MKLKRAHLVNFCQHEDLTAEFSDITGIFGPNGSGKSNLLRAIKFSLTGSLAGTKNDNVRRTSHEVPEAYVETFWEMDNGYQVEIYRSLRSAECWVRHLDRDGGVIASATSSQESSQLIQELTRVSKKVIENFYFVDQDNLRSLVLMTKADRTRLLMDILSLENLEFLWEKLGQVSSEDRLLLATGVESMQLIQQQIEELNGEIALLEVQRDGIQLLSEDHRREKVRLLESMDEYLRLSAEVENLRQQISRCQESLREHQQESCKAQQEIAVLQEKIRQAEEYIRRHDDLIQQLPQIQAHNQRIEEAEQQLAQLRSHPVVEPAAPGEKPDKYARQIASTMEKLTEVRYRLRAIKESRGKSTCPVCQQPANLKKMAEELVPQEKMLADELAKLESKAQELESQWEKYRRDKEAYDNYRKSLEQWEAYRKSLGDRKPIDQALFSEYKRIQSHRDKLLGQLANCKSRQQYAAALSSKLQQELEEIQRKLDSARVSMEGCTVHDSQLYSRIEKQLQDDDRQREVFQNLERTIELRKQDLQKAKRALQAAQERNLLAKRAEVWLDRLDRWRSVIHRSVLAEALIHEFMRLYVEESNRFLDEFDAPFRLVFREGADFAVRMEDGSMEKPDRLSKGQSVVLAICLQLAGHNLVDSSLRVLALDEPTDGLDRKNLGYLADVLAGSVQKVKSLGRQILIVTHQEQLRSFVESAVDLYGSPAVYWNQRAYAAAQHP